MLCTAPLNCLIQKQNNDKKYQKVSYLPMIKQMYKTV